MALTKFQIRINRSVYEVLFKMTSYAASGIEVVDLPSLFAKESLEEFKRRFESKKFRIQDKYAFSFNSVELFVFCKYVGTIMQEAGVYERAVYFHLYETQIQPQISREIQIRINYNFRANE